jgi:hypothetical protein
MNLAIAPPRRVTLVAPCVVRRNGAAPEPLGFSGRRADMGIAAMDPSAAAGHGAGRLRGLLIGPAAQAPRDRHPREQQHCALVPKPHERPAVISIFRGRSDGVSGAVAETRDSKRGSTTTKRAWAWDSHCSQCRVLGCNSFSLRFVITARPHAGPSLHPNTADSFCVQPKYQRKSAERRCQASSSSLAC